MGKTIGPRVKRSVPLWSTREAHAGGLSPPSCGWVTRDALVLLDGAGGDCKSPARRHASDGGAKPSR